MKLSLIHIFYHFYKSKEEVTSDLYLFFDTHMEKELLIMPEEPVARLKSITREMMRYSLEWGLPFLRLSCAQTSGEKEINLVHERSVSFQELVLTLKSGIEQGAVSYTHLGIHRLGGLHPDYQSSSPEESALYPGDAQ